MSTIFFALRDSVARISVTSSRAKVANLRRDPRASLWVPGDDVFHWLVLDGSVDLSEVASDPSDAVCDELVDLYGAHGDVHPNWEEFRSAMVADQRLVLRFTPHHAYGMWS